MHPRAFHRAQVCDSAAELGLERVLIACVLDELAHAEAGILVHCRETAAALGQTLPGQLHAGIADALDRHFDRVRPWLHAIRNLRSVQCLCDRSLVLGCKVAVEEAVAWATRPEYDRDTGSDRSGDSYQQQDRLQARGQSRRRRHCCNFGGHG